MDYLDFIWDEDKNRKNRENDKIIRIISARKATVKERKQYGGEK